MLEGELIDSDGTVFKAGDFVSFAPGTHHSSRTETGCVLAVFEWRDKPETEPHRPILARAGEVRWGRW